MNDHITPRFSTLEDWLSWQENLHSKEIDLGLDRIRAVGNSLGVLEPRSKTAHSEVDTKVITVAGTNGKGSCVSVMESLLKAKGRSFGAYTSPHIHRYNERVRVNGVPVSDETLCEAFHAIDVARGDVSLSYFEFGTLAALYIFYHANLDFWLLEVGLGGRLDGVNIVDPDIAIITSIALDHVSWLGDNREDIGREKAGICRANTPLICVDQDMPQSIQQVALSLECPRYYWKDAISWYEGEGDLICLKIASSTGDSKKITCPKHCLTLPIPSVAAALQACELANVLVDDEQIVQALSDSNLTGRFQLVSKNNINYLFDVAHNPAAVTHLSDRLKSEYSDCEIHAVIGMLSDKDFAGALKAFDLSVEHWYLSNLLDTSRALKPELMHQELLRLGYNEAQLSIHDSVASAIDCMKDTVERDLSQLTEKAEDKKAEYKKADYKKANKQLIVIFGSFFTVAEGLNRIN